MTYLYIFLGGGIGSLARYLVSKAAERWIPTNFPLGTLLTNLLACGILAWIVVAFAGRQQEYPWLQPLMLIGFCGGFSTFSTFGNETYSLLHNGHVWMAVANILISVIAGVGLIFLIRSRA